MMLNVCVNMEGHCGMWAADSPVVLSCFVFFLLVLFYFVLFILCSECEYYCMGSLEKVRVLSFKLIYFGHTSILCLCIQYTVVPHFSRQQFLPFLLFWYVGSIGISLINPFILSQLKIPLGKTAYYCMHFKDKFRLWSEAWICQRF